MSLLRSFDSNATPNTAVVQTRIVSRVLLRVGKRTLPILQKHFLIIVCSAMATDILPSGQASSARRHQGYP